MQNWSCKASWGKEAPHWNIFKFRPNALIRIRYSLLFGPCSPSLVWIIPFIIFVSIFSSCCKSFVHKGKSNSRNRIKLIVEYNLQLSHFFQLFLRKNIIVCLATQDEILLILISIRTWCYLNLYLTRITRNWIYRHTHTHANWFTFAHMKSNHSHDRSLVWVNCTCDQ